MFYRGTHHRRVKPVPRRWRNRFRGDRGHPILESARHNDPPPPPRFDFPNRHTIPQMPCDNNNRARAQSADFLYTSPRRPEAIPTPPENECDTPHTKIENPPELPQEVYDTVPLC